MRHSHVVEKPPAQRNLASGFNHDHFMISMIWPGPNVRDSSYFQSTCTIFKAKLFTFLRCIPVAKPLYLFVLEYAFIVPTAACGYE